MFLICIQCFDQLRQYEITCHIRILPVDNNSKVSTSEIISLIYYMHINSNNSSLMTSIKQSTSFMGELGKIGTINPFKTLAEYWYFQLKTTYWDIFYRYHFFNKSFIIKHRNLFFKCFSFFHFFKELWFFFTNEF